MAESSGNRSSDLTEAYGPWALVTGATRGIGACFSRRLAELGFDLVLVARHRQALVERARALEGEHGIGVRPLAIDLSRANAVDRIAEATTDLEIGLLINNAAVYSPGSFLWRDPATLGHVVQIDALTPMHLAHHFGRPMADRRRGGIIFVGSNVAYHPMPYLADYTASKAFILHLGESLHAELAELGVDVLVVSPGPTRTRMMDAEGIDFGRLKVNYLEPELTVEAALANIGRRASVVVGPLARLSAWVLSRLLPRGTLLRLMHRSMLRCVCRERIYGKHKALEHAEIDIESPRSVA